MKIKEFENGLRLTQALLISKFTKGVTQNGAPYLSITLQDNSGEIEGKLWDVKPEVEARIHAGVIAEFSFDVLQYRQNLQIRIHAVNFKDQSDYNLYDFVSTSELDVDFLKKEIKGYVDLLEDPVLKGIVQGCFDYYGDAFYQYPAATRNHHDFVGGLAVHVYGMCRLAVAICELYPVYNQDLLLAGVLVHDMGKIEEYSAPILSEYTPLGKLVGHISIMQANVVKIADTLGYGDSEQLLLLRHMILAHHGQYDYGSPVLPLVKEAEVLHFIDNLDARTNMFDKLYENLDEGSFSSRVFALDNRMFYKSKGVK